MTDRPPLQPATSLELELRAANEELRARLQEAQDTLEAIRAGAVDAFVVRAAGGERIYTLQTADEPYRLMVEQMKQGAATLTPEGLVLYVNPPLACLRGTPSGQIVGAPFAELFPQEEGPAIRGLIAEAQTRACAFESRLLDSERREIPVYLSASPLRTETPVVCVMVTDLTEQKRYEALEVALKHFQTLADCSPVPIWVTGPEGRIQFINNACAQFLGISGVEAHDRSWRSFLHPEDAAAYADALEEALSERRQFHAEARARRADGEWRWMASYGAPWFSASGEFLGCVGSSPDVTEMKRIEAAVRDSEERFRLATEAMQGIVYDWDMASGVVTRSRGLLDLLGYAPEEVTDRNLEWWGEQAHRTDWDRCTAQYSAAAAAGASALDMEYRVHHRDGRYVWVWDHGRISYDDEGRPQRLTGCVISIDAQKRAEEALKRADRQKDRFLATLAHELRNPLAPIRNAVAVLKAKCPENPELEWGRDLIDRQVEHMARLLDDLLEVSRITQNKLQLRKERIELRAVVNSAVETSRPLIEARDHDLTVSLPQEPVYLNADPVRLSQAFSNLLNNAAKYTDRGGRLWLTGRRELGEVVVSFRDTGIGISRDVLPDLFEMFTQGAAAADRSEGGLGIGLSLVRGLVHLHGGSVEARSEGPGRGSEFIVRLPLAAGAPTPWKGTERVPSGPTAPLRVLVADDNRDTAESLAVVLSLHGYDVRTAFDGDEALAVAEEFRPQVALLDIGMPKTSGHEVARRIREQSWGGEVVLIAQTGWGQEEDLRRTREAGFDHHLVKPVAPGAINQLLDTLQPPRHPGTPQA